jgi:hypothetical protein
MIITKEEKFTESQQKDLVELANQSYDRGGADALAIVIETAMQIAKDEPNLKAYAGFVIHVVEGVRQRLAEVVAGQQVMDIEPY